MKADLTTRSSNFGNDPYVAVGAIERTVPRSVDEILSALNGYESRATQMPSNDSRSSRMGAGSCNTHSHMVLDPACHSTADSELLLESLGDLERLMIAFSDPSEVEPVPEARPEPIQGSFDCDPDYFDLHSSRQCANQPLAMPSLDAQRPTCGPPPSSAIADEISASDQIGVIWAKENELIHVDGKDGYEYIDLTCFDLLQASFEANRIRIRTQSHHFEVEYRNVSYAVFAGGQQVELAAFEMGFVPLPTPVA